MKGLKIIAIIMALVTCVSVLSACGNNEEIAFDCYVPIETHAMAYVECENVGEYESILDAAIVVQYEDFIEPESIVGYEGINLRRR